MDESLSGAHVLLSADAAEPHAEGREESRAQNAPDVDTGELTGGEGDRRRGV